ncbi:MAG: MFS transporter [Thermoflexaceae bacterium]|nr:MFS transporter [Thermoflexaceae bacterium]
MLWQNRDFLKLWAGQTVSLFGTLLGALPFTAIFIIHASAMEMALLSAAQMLPGFLAGLVAGAWVDRLRRRPLMIAADLGRAALLGSIFVAAWFDVLRIEHLFAAAFATGALTILFDVAYHAYLPTIVEPRALTEGNAKLAASASVAEAGSFSAGGWVVQFASAQAAVLADALSFIVSAMCLGAIRAPEPQPSPRGEREGILPEIGEGLRVLFVDPALRALALANIARHFGYGAIGAVILLFVTEGELGMSPGLVGVIFAVGGVSSLFGAGLAGRAARRFGVGPAMVCGLSVAAVASLCIPLAPDSSLTGIAFLVAQQLFGDAADTVFDINEISLRQALVPARLLGRIEASIRFLSLGVMLLGALAAGVIASQVDLRAALVTGTMGMAAASLFVLFSPARQVRTIDGPKGLH